MRKVKQRSTTIVDDSARVIYGHTLSEGAPFAVAEGLRDAVAAPDLLRPRFPLHQGALKPFWRYYGGKWRAAPRYPSPKHSIIIEPFAGAAGYSMRYPERQVVLVEKHPVVAELWRFLISVHPSEILSIPLVDDVRDLPSWVSVGGRHLVGFAMNAATTTPCVRISSGRKKLREMGRVYEGWSESLRMRVASQVGRIRHWRIIEGDYTSAPDVEATWFVDPPYNNKAGRYYPCHDLDYTALGVWCRERRGQVMVCENEGATWLPFKPFAVFKAGVNGNGSREAIWESHEPV